MSWPLSQDYNEAIQNPATSLGDPALMRGEPVVNAMGLPIPRSGNFADVYQFRDGEGKAWALKCFTRQVRGLQERYGAIDAHLGQAKLPFTVGFRFLSQGIRIRGQWYPLLQMEWVEGFTLNDFIRQNASKTAYLEALFLMWVRLVKRLRDAEVAHGDLQHGNVLLVPGPKATTLGLKLIDYDGMWVPELADRPSGEAGHPAYQHPARRTGVYCPDVDRFPHLLIACALRALIVGGPDLWAKFDNGDNLLFREEDIRNPAGSSLVKTLWDLNDPIVRPLLGRLVLATKLPLTKTPWLDELMASGETLALSAGERRTLGQMLDYTLEPAELAAPEAAPNENWVPATPEDVFAALRAPADDNLQTITVRTALSLYWLIPVAAVGFGLVLVIVAAFLLLFDRKPKSAGPTVAPMPASSAPAAAKQEPVPPLVPRVTEPEVEDLAVAPRALPPPRLEVVSPVWSVKGRAAPGCLEISGDGKHVVASPGASDELFGYGIRDGSRLIKTDPGVGKIKALCAVGADQVIVTSDDNEAALWDLLGETRIRRLQTMPGDPTPFSAAPDGADAVCPGSTGWQVIRYGMDTGQQNKSWGDDSEVKVVSVRYSPDGAYWAAVDESFTTTVHDPKAEGQRSAAMRDPSKTARVALLASGGKRMITFGKGDELRVWDVPSRKVLHVLPGHAGGVTDAVITPDGRWVLSVGADKKLKAWDAESGREVQDVELPEVASCVRLGPTGKIAATASAGGARAAIQLWRLAAEPKPAE